MDEPRKAKYGISGMLQVEVGGCADALFIL